MNSSKINYRLGVLAVLLTADLFAGYSASGDHPNRFADNWPVAFE